MAEKDIWAELFNNAEVKHEIKYSGKALSDKLSASLESRLPKSLFQLKLLNFLQLSDSVLLTEIPQELGCLVELTNLVLRSNRLQKLPSTIGQLSKLKYLDVSFNQLDEFSTEICKCVELQTVNVSNNKIVSLPEEIRQLNHLAHFDASYNEFQSCFPLALCQDSLYHLADVNFKANKLDSIPYEIHRLISLKILNLAENAVGVVPGELGECQKLKELYLDNNKLNDKRLAKLIAQCQQKSIIDYVRKNCPKLKPVSAGTKKSGEKKKKSKSGPGKNVANETGEDAEEEKEMDKIIVLPCSENFKITIKESALVDLRPFLLCCIVKNLDFSNIKLLKKFLALQSKLHDEECKKRVAATIATHDLKKIDDPLIFTSMSPKDILIRPLGRPKDCSAEELMSNLTEEADALRKEKKRNVYSGIHQYLYLLKDKEKYPVILNKDNHVISFPPITNSDLTKISLETTDVLVEVSSSQNLAVCKRVMEMLIKEILRLDITKKSSPPDSDNETDSVPNKNDNKILTIQQVKIVNEENALKATFPSKSDLAFDDVQVVRDWLKTED